MIDEMREHELISGLRDAFGSEPLDADRAQEMLSGARNSLAAPQERRSGLLGRAAPVAASVAIIAILAAGFLGGDVFGAHSPSTDQAFAREVAVRALKVRASSAPAGTVVHQRIEFDRTIAGDQVSRRIETWKSWDGMRQRIERASSRGGDDSSRSTSVETFDGARRVTLSEGDGGTELTLDVVPRYTPHSLGCDPKRSETVTAVPFDHSLEEYLRCQDCHRMDPETGAYGLTESAQGSTSAESARKNLIETELRAGGMSLAGERSTPLGSAYVLRSTHGTERIDIWITVEGSEIVKRTVSRLGYDYRRKRDTWQVVERLEFGPKELLPLDRFEESFFASRIPHAPYGLRGRLATSGALDAFDIFPIYWMGSTFDRPPAAGVAPIAPNSEMTLETGSFLVGWPSTGPGSQPAGLGRMPSQVIARVQAYVSPSAKAAADPIWISSAPREARQLLLSEPHTVSSSGEVAGQRVIWLERPNHLPRTQKESTIRAVVVDVGDALVRVEMSDRARSLDPETLEYVVKRLVRAN